jgi:hypothetical protein
LHRHLFRKVKKILAPQLPANHSLVSGLEQRLQHPQNLRHQILLLQKNLRPPCLCFLHFHYHTDQRLLHLNHQYKMMHQVLPRYHCRQNILQFQRQMQQRRQNLLHQLQLKLHRHRHLLLQQKMQQDLLR